jgi:uncharacterized membrane protein YkoI
MSLLTWFSWRPLNAAVLTLSLCLLAGAASGGQEGQIGVVDDSSGGLLTELDLARISPELAGQLTAYLASASDEKTGTGFFEDDQKGKGKEDKKGKGKEDKKKEQVVTVDLNKLPPDLAKQLLKYLRDAEEKGKGKEKGAGKGKDKGKDKGAEKKGGGKVISLEEAIAIAEKLGKGKAVKAERKGEGSDASFKVEVVGKDGTKSKIQLNAQGETPEAIGYPKMEPEKKDGKKPGKGKE